MGNCELGATIRELILERWPGRFDEDQIGSEVALGSEGLGLDSLEMVEVISACEDLLARAAPPRLFTIAPLTVGAMVECFSS